MGGYEGGTAQVAGHPAGHQTAEERTGYQVAGQSPSSDIIVCTEFTSVFMNVSLYEAWITRYGMYSIKIMCYSCLYRDIVLITYI